MAVCPSNSIGIDADTICPSWSRCAPAVRCAGTSAPGAACATRPCGRRRPRSTDAGWTAPVEVTARTPPTPTGRSPAGHRPTASGRCSSATPCAAPVAHRRRPGRRGGHRDAPGPLAAGEIDGALVVQAERRPRRAVEGCRHRRHHPGRGDRAASGSFYNQTMALAELDLPPLRPAGQAPARRRRDALRDPGDPGHAGPALADRGPPGRRRRAHHRPAVHEELRLRGPHAARAARQAGRRPRPGQQGRRHPRPDDRRVPRRASWPSTSR